MSLKWRKPRPSSTVDVLFLLDLFASETALDSAVSEQLLYPGFVLSVERVTLPELLDLRVVYDGNLEPRVRLPFADHEVILADMEAEIAGVGWTRIRVNLFNGVLAAVGLVGPADWPADLRVEQVRWCSGEPDPRRVARAKPPAPSSVPAWLAGVDFGNDAILATGASQNDVAHLPTELQDFLRFSNGATLWGNVLLPASLLETVDDGERRFIIFSPGPDGGGYGIDLTDATHPVVDCSPGMAPIPVADSFKSWIRSLADGATNSE